VGMIIQSILLPRGFSMDALRKKKELAWLLDADFENGQEYSQYVKFAQMPVEKFDRGSLALAKVDDHGVWVVGGKLLDQKDAKDALEISSAVAQKFEIDAVSGEGETETKEKGGEEMELFKTKEEFVEAVTEIFKAAREAEKAADEEAKKAAEAAAEEEKKKAAAAEAEKPPVTSVTPDKLAELEKTVAEIGKSVKELTEKTEKIAQTAVTDPASTEPDDKTQTKEGEPQKKSVFGGVFMKKK